MRRNEVVFYYGNSSETIYERTFAANNGSNHSSLRTYSTRLPPKCYRSRKWETTHYGTLIRNGKVVKKNVILTGAI